MNANIDLGHLEELSGSTKQNTYSFEDNFLQYNKLPVFSDIALIRKVYN